MLRGRETVAERKPGTLRRAGRETIAERKPGTLRRAGEHFAELDTSQSWSFFRIKY